MRLLCTSALSIFSIVLSLQIALAKPCPNHATIDCAAENQRLPSFQPRRRDLVHGLPPGWTAVFQTVTSIQPPLINQAFVQFFSVAANVAAADPVPGRHSQRIFFGSLVLEFIASGDVNHIVGKEFVVAASVWLLDAAKNGWTGLFKAWVLDQTDGELIFVRLGTVWDELMALSY